MIKFILQLSYLRRNVRWPAQARPGKLERQDRP